jgi:outer membrane protein OmpA-like peptidoglycan-associated protein
MLKAFKTSYQPEENKKKENKEEDNWIAKTNNEIKGAELGLENAPVKKIKVKPLSQAINSAYTESAPVVVSDSVIYYTSLNEDKLVFIEKKKDIPSYRLFQSTKVDGEWQKGKALPDFINSEEFGTGTAAISEDGNRMYFSRCYNSEIDEVICNLFFSEKTPKGKWQEPIKLNTQINNPKYTSTHPAVRTSGDRMDIVYFVSDREGGIGGMDIWYFIRTARGDFKGPRVVKGINTKEDELSPFYDNEKQRLFFSSNGYPSLGGFDVFMSEEDEELGWNEPQNVGKPINSPADDLFYTIQAKDGSSGFLVSNREGTSLVNKRYPGDDIFYFEDWKYGLEGFVFKSDKEGDGPLEGATITLYEVDDSGNELVLKTLENVSEEYFLNLKPEKDYKVEVNKAGFAPKYEYVSTKDIPYEDTLLQNLSVDRTSLAVLGSLYDDTDTLKKEKLYDAIISLNENLPNGNTRTISSKRITEKNKDFSFDIEANKSYTINVVKDGYFKKKVDLANNNDDLKQDIFLSKIEVGKSYELANVLYDFGKSTLRKESKEVLNDLLEILQENPTIIVELSAHTDNIGSAESNLKLSQARAQSCVDYLVANGIPESRLVAKGYGMSKPIAENTNEDGSDNPEGRQKNRRTEFKVIGGF